MEIKTIKTRTILNKKNKFGGLSAQLKYQVIKPKKDKRKVKQCLPLESASE